MAVTNFIPEVWTARLLSSLKKALVIASPAVMNRDYEGEISGAGDSVTINSVGRPTVGNYVPGSTTITPERLTTAARKLTITESKYFAFEVDDVDARQAKGNIMPEGMQEAAYALADVADQFVEALIRSSVIADNALGTVNLAAANPEDAYDDLLISLGVALDEKDIPKEGRYAIVPPWVHGRLLRDSRFVSFGTDQNRQTLTNGIVGAAAGFQISVSNNLPIVTGDDYSVLAGHPMATTYAEQINKTEAYRPENGFADAVKGLHLYGAKVTRPYAVATALASIT